MAPSFQTDLILSLPDIHYIILYDLNACLRVYRTVPTEFKESNNWTTTDNIVDNSDDELMLQTKVGVETGTDAMMRLDW